MVATITTFTVFKASYTECTLMTRQTLKSHSHPGKPCLTDMSLGAAWETLGSCTVALIMFSERWSCLPCLDCFKATCANWIYGVKKSCATCEGSGMLRASPSSVSKRGSPAPLNRRMAARAIENTNFSLVEVMFLIHDHHRCGDCAWKGSELLQGGRGGRDHLTLKALKRIQTSPHTIGGKFCLKGKGGAGGGGARCRGVSLKEAFGCGFWNHTAADGFWPQTTHRDC